MILSNFIQEFVFIFKFIELRSIKLKKVITNIQMNKKNKGDFLNSN